MLQHDTPVTRRVSLKESAPFNSLHSTTVPFNSAVALRVRVMVISTGPPVPALFGTSTQNAELPLKVQVKVTISSR